MKKSQKIWLAISLSMFLIPELLWGGVIAKFVYYWILNGSVENGIINFNFFQLSNTLIKYVYLIEFFGALLSFIFLIKFYNPKNKLLKFIFLLFLTIPLLVGVGYVIFASSLGNLP